MKVNLLFRTADSEDVTVRNQNSQVAGWHSWLGRPMAALAIVIGMTTGSTSLMAQEFPYQVSVRSSSSRPAGGGDIVVLDIVDEATATARPAGGTVGGGDIVVFDINGVAPAEARPTGGNGGGGDITDFVIVGVAADFPAALWCVVVKGDKCLVGILELDEYIVCSKSDGTAVAGGLLWLEDGGPVSVGIQLQIQF